MSFRRPRPYQLVGLESRWAVRLLSIRRVDRLCHYVFFTLASLRHAAAQVVMVRLLRVGRWPKPCEPFLFAKPLLLLGFGLEIIRTLLFAFSPDVLILLTAQLLGGGISAAAVGECQAPVSDWVLAAPINLSVSARITE
jgi:hypothetical protein